MCKGDKRAICVVALLTAWAVAEAVMLCITNVNY